MARKSFKGSHVELRHNTYFAILVVPKDVRQQIGKSKFFKTTGTGDRKLAETRASAMILGWKAEINAARSQADDPVLKSALELLALLQDKRTSHLVKDAIDEEANRLRVENGDLVADTFKDVATGVSKPLSTHIDSWVEHQIQRGLAQKTIDQMTSDVKLMTETIQAPNLLTELHVKAWIGLITKDGKTTASSITRLIGSSTNFFKYLKFVEEIDKNKPNPFIVPDAYRISKKSNSKSINKTTPWVPFKENECC